MLIMKKHAHLMIFSLFLAIPSCSLTSKATPEERGLGIGKTANKI